MANCNCNKTVNEIIMEFGSDEIMEKCRNCECLEYRDGTMTCKKVEEKSGENNDN